MHVVHSVGEVLEHCKVCRAFRKASHVPILGASAVSTFGGKLRVDTLFLDDFFASHAKDLYSECSFSIPERSKNSPEVRDVSLIA